MNKFFCKLCTCFVVLMIILGGGIVNANIAFEPSEGIDAILVIDTSGSMNSADPERITLEAASLFMDMMETRNSRIAIVGFSGSLHSVMPLTSINDPNIRDDIRNSLSQFVFHGWTDIGMAMREAAQMLIDDPHPTNSPMILLFTDGRIELSQWGQRTVEDSYADAWWAVDTVGEFAPIYTIGLNYDGTLHVEFLEEIARRTSARSYIADDANELPQIFNEIFASHIRSSITEVATVVLGDSFTDILIPIPSAFVAEANIIMLSSRPIIDVRLIDPSGREVFFDYDTYTLTYANRYSMIKILNPMIGEWLLRVQGIPEERITVNLIYNYNVDVAMSISQRDGTGLFFNPKLPILVQATFISTLPNAQVQALFSEAEANLFVYNTAMQLLTAMPMHNTGASFVSEFDFGPLQDIRISVGVTHPGFSQVTPVMTVNFDPDLLDTMSPTPSPSPTPTPSPPIPTPSPTPEPIPEEDEDNGRTILPIILGVAGVACVCGLLLYLFSSKKNKKSIFAGYLELRAMNNEGMYSPLEAPDLSTFVGKISLAEFLNNSLGVRAESIIKSDIPIWDIHIQPEVANGRHILLLTNNSGCQITDSDGNSISAKKLTWHSNQQLVFAKPDSMARLEVTYRVEE